MPNVKITEAGKAKAGEAKAIAVTRLSSKIITGVKTTSGKLKLISWNVSAAGPITRLADASAGDIEKIAMCGWPGVTGVITALRIPGAKLKLISWTVASDGIIKRAKDLTGTGIKEVAVCSPSGFTGVVSATTTSSGELRVNAWKVSGTGVFTKAGEGTGGKCTKPGVYELNKVNSLARVATVFRTESGNLKIITWSVSKEGVVKRLSEISAGAVAEVAATFRATSPNADLFTLSVGSGGSVKLIGWQIDDDGKIKRFTEATGGKATKPALFNWKPDIHSYAVGAMKTGSGKLKLIVWRNGADLVRNGAFDSVDVGEIFLAGWTKGVVTISQNGNGDLELVSWKLEAVGIRLLHYVWDGAGLSLTKFPDIDVKPLLRSRIKTRGGDLPYEDYPNPGPPPQPGPGDGDSTASPNYKLRFFPAAQGVDPMIAVGHKFVVVTQDHAIAFLDRSGNALPPKKTESTNMSATAFFIGFISATNADGSPNPDNINLISPTVISEFYDTRCYYDAGSKRFVILSAAREPGTTVIRYYAMAVSRTEDPRDGFQQYMTTESNYRDFPRMTVQGDRIYVAHNAAAPAAEGERPVLSAFPLSQMRQGKIEPPNWQYYPSDLNGARRIFIVAHYGDTGGMSIAFDIRKGDPILRTIAFPLAGAANLTPVPVFSEVTLGSQAMWPGPHGVFRNKKLYLCGNVQITARVPNVAPPRNSVRVIIVPFSQFSTGDVTLDSAKVVDHFFGLNAKSDDPTDKVTYDFPGIAVNKNGDIFFGYGRTGVTTVNPLFPEARYSLWYNGEPKQRRSRLLQAGGYQPTSVFSGETMATSDTHIYKLDYATAVIDPLDDLSFWFIHEYADAPTTSWRAVAGKVDPAG